MATRKPIIGIAGTLQELSASDTLEGVATTASNSFTGTQELNNNNVTEAKTITFNGEYDNGNSGASKTIDFANGQKQRVLINTDSAVLTIASPSAVGDYKLRVIQDATGHSFTVAGVSSSRWLGSATTPAFNTSANGETLFAFYFDGTNLTQSAAKVGAA